MADDGNTEGLVELDIDNQEEFNRIVKREKRDISFCINLYSYSSRKK